MSRDVKVSAKNLVNELNKCMQQADIDKGFEIHRYNGITSTPISIDKYINSDTLNEVDFHFRMGQLSKSLQSFSRPKKLAWSLERKNKGNMLYLKGDVDAAIKMYMDATLGLDFGRDESEEKQAEHLILLPLLTNLAACFLKKKKFDKAIQFCNG